MYGGFVAYPRNEAVKVLRSYRNFMAHAPDELTVYAGLMSTPDGQPAVALMMCYCGTESDGERVTRPLREIGTPLFDCCPTFSLRLSNSAEISKPSWRNPG